MATLLLGAAFGLALGYVLHAAIPSERRGGRGRSGPVIDTLNGLIETCKDGEIGFRTAAEEVKSAEVRTLFNEAADRCAQGAAELQRKVRALGGEPEDTGSSIGMLHRRWLNLRSAITGKDDAAILDEVERGEDSAKAAYEAALKRELPEDVRAMIERQYRGVRQNHNRVREKRNAAR